MKLLVSIMIRPGDSAQGRQSNIVLPEYAGKFPGLPAIRNLRLPGYRAVQLA